MNNLIVSAGNAIKGFAGKSGLLIQKYSPEILLGAGLATGVAGVVLACKATTKRDEILQRYEDQKAIINEAYEIGYVGNGDGESEEYTEKDYKKDNAKNTLKQWVNLQKFMLLQLEL